MSLSIIQSPDLLSPLNDVWGNYWQFQDAADYTKNNFQYYVDLYYGTSSTADNFLLTATMPPRPTDGTGVFSPYKALSSLLSYDIDFAISTTGSAYNSVNGIVNYQIGYGFQYNPSLTFSVSNTSDLFTITFAAPPSFQTGDQVFIQSQNPYINGGLWTLTVFSTVAFQLNIAYTSSSPVMSGLLTFLQHHGGTSSVYYGYNGTRQYGEQNINYNDVIIQNAGLSYSNAPFLTDYPISEKKYIQTSQKETLSAFFNVSDFYDFATYSFETKFDFYDVNNTFISSFNKGTNLSAATYINKFDIPVGTAGVSLPAGTDHYTVILYKITGATSSQTRTFYIDNSCSIYPNVRVMWMNSFGSFEFFTFTKDDMKSYNINKTEYKKELPFNYTTGMRNRTVLSSQIYEQHTVNSNWVNQNIYSFLVGIETSPEVYIIDEISNLAYPMIITDTSCTFKTQNRERLFNMIITYQTSYQIESQNN